jgi:hypothetical protein
MKILFILTSKLGKDRRLRNDIMIVMQTGNYLKEGDCVTPP